METHSPLELCLYTWGANSYGQLGQGHAEDQCVPRLCDSSALQDRSVRTVSGGGGHTVVITGNGEVFVCGQNHRGQLGLGHYANIATLRLCPIANEKVTNVACGWDFTLFLIISGKVLACGSNTFGQLGVEQAITHSAELLAVTNLKEPVVSIAAGLRHAVAIGDSGCVFQWGTGLFSHAKRALRPHPVPPHLCSKVPYLVPGFERCTPRSVAAGSAHCMCLTGDGDLFVWGSNKHSLLQTAESFLPNPTLLKRSLLNGEKVTDVCCGWTHVVARTESGQVFTWGRGDYGQLGRRTSSSHNSELSSGSVAEDESQIEAVYLPAAVEALNGATKIACGSEHSLAVVGGHLLSWGWNEHGMCGDGSQTDVFHPQLASDLKPVLIGCGAGHSIAVCTVTTDWRQDSV